MAKSVNTRKNRISKKAKFRMFFFFIIFGGIIGSLSYSFFSNINKIISINKEKQVLNNKINELYEEEEILNSDIKKLEDPDYVARYAREKYLYSKDGELIIRIPDNTNSLFSLTSSELVSSSLSISSFGR